MLLRQRTVILVLAALCAFARVAEAQSSSLFRQSMPAEAPLTLDRASWTYIEAPPRREVQKHDIITIIVDEKSQVISESSFDRRKDANLKAELKEFIRLDEDFNLANAALNAPTVDAKQASRLQSSGDLEVLDALRYRLAATVVDVRPNGTLVLEARKTIEASEQTWVYALTGIVRREDIQPNNTVLSEDIAELHIYKNERGKVRDSTKRGWFLRLWDIVTPI